MMMKLMMYFLIIDMKMTYIILFSQEDIGTVKFSHQETL